MDNTIVAQHIRRANRNLLWTNVALVVALMGLALVCGRYLCNFLLGPFPMDRNKLLTLSRDNVPFDYYLTVDYGDQKPLEVEKEVTRKVNKRTGAVESEVVSAQFVAVVVSDKWLIIKLPPFASPKSPVTGSLTDMPSYLRDEIAKAPLGRDGIPVEDKFVPVMLDAQSNFRVAGFFGLGIGLPLYAFGVWNIVRALRRGQRLERHPIAASLKSFGEPVEVAEHIHREACDPSGSVQFGKLQLTSSWLLRPSTYGLKVVHTTDVLWIYKKVTKHSYNGIPTGTTHAAVICTRHGESLEVPAGGPSTENILEEVYRRAPWVIAGFSDELAAAYKSDRQGMAHAVDDRRRQVMEEVQRQNAPENGPPA